MEISRKIAPETNITIPQMFKTRPYEDKIDFDKLRLYRLDRVREE